MIDFLSEYFDFNFLSSFPARLLLSFFTAFFIVVLPGRKFISFLRHKQGKGQPIREDGPQSHLLTKKGTPTMGGIMIIGSILLSTLLWGKINNIFVITSLVVLVIYALVGFIDDYEKVTKQTSNAMTPKMKLLLQFTVSLLCILTVCHATPNEIEFSIRLPFIKYFILNLSWFYIPFAMVVIAGASNAVNLTDGLDGLAAGLLAIIFSFFVLICFESSMMIKGADEVAIICASVVGGCVGFLWFNFYPAKVFMGDTGSLSLGALLGTVSVITKSEFMLALVGLIFVVEAVSVMLQVLWFKKTGKRIFRMAPIHHHFEQLGLPETTIVIRFWIIGLILAIIGLVAVA
ncbi:MAG: phospho-N-acetylmuramoyl-pentapeptide-transferase [Lactobacillaceae bacterium]|jgi:phospho-N-acetylmuramoyl-pentapeptide-transferase|nr:phospho-N-acetylmuramoyl-pentapeptide-transferase [Lactobacillaceae bacterium]